MTEVVTGFNHDDVQNLAGKLLIFREDLLPGEQRAFDRLLHAAARFDSDPDLVPHGLLEGTALARLARVVGVSTVALSLAFTLSAAPSSAAPAPTAVGTAAPAVGARPVTAADQEALQFLSKLNDYRKANGLGAVALDSVLQGGSDWMSQDVMTHCLAKGLYSAPCDDGRATVHIDSQGRGIDTRLHAFGYPAAASIGEITFMGSPGFADSSDSALTWWKNSPPHNAQMLTPGYTAVGISRLCTGAGCVWVTNFGSQLVKATGTTAPPPVVTPPPPTGGGTGTGQNPGGTGGTTTAPSHVNRSSAAYVRWIQTSLNTLQHANLAVDGINGPLTQAAVRAFQGGHNCAVDGIVGPQTEAALLVAGAAAPPH